MKIDAHQHFWAMERGDYGWLTPDLGPIYRDFGPDDLTPLLTSQSIDGTILVQAAPTLAETRYMLSLAEQNGFIKGVVGWVNFEAADAPATIKNFAQRPKLVGLRPMIQDIADPDWMLQDRLTPAFEAMIAAGLTFDALTLPHHLGNLLTLLKRHPDLPAVIDHGAKPDIKEGAFDGWAKDMAALASETQALVKLSGLVTEAGPNWTVTDLKPYVDHLLTHFGPARMIWGSDWPVCTLASSYATWCEASKSLLSDLTAGQKAAIWGGNAIRFYGLETTR